MKEELICTQKHCTAIELDGNTYYVKTKYSGKNMPTPISYKKFYKFVRESENISWVFGERVSGNDLSERILAAYKEQKINGENKQELNSTANAEINVEAKKAPEIVVQEDKAQEQPLEEKVKRDSREIPDETKYWAEYYRKNKDKIIAQQAEHRRKNRDKINAYKAEYRRIHRNQRAEYYKKNIDKINAYKAEYCRTHNDQRREYWRAYYEKNKDKIKARIAAYCQSHKEQRAKQRVEYYRTHKDKRNEYLRKNKDRIAKQKAEYCRKNKDRIAKQKAEYLRKNKDKIAKLRQQKQEEAVKHSEKKPAEKKINLEQAVESANDILFRFTAPAAEFLKQRGYLPEIDGHFAVYVYNESEKLGNLWLDKIGERKADSESEWIFEYDMSHGRIGMEPRLKQLLLEHIGDVNKRLGLNIALEVEKDYRFEPGNNRKRKDVQIERALKQEEKQKEAMEHAAV